MGNQETSQVQFIGKDQNSKGLKQDEVQSIRAAFDSFNPQNGVIQINDVKSKYNHSYQKSKLDQLFEGKNEIDYQTFYLFLFDYIQEQKKLFGNDIEYDGDSNQPPVMSTDCLNCYQTINKSQ